MIISDNQIGKIFAFLLLLFPVLFNQLNWYDEFFVIMSALVYFSKVNRTPEPNENKIFLIIIILGILGALSNINSQLTDNYTSTLIDYFSLYKSFLVFIFCREIFNAKARSIFVKTLTPVCKMYLYVCTFTGILSQFVDLGMTLEELRYGIKPFGFLFLSNVFPTTIIISFMIISFSTETEKCRNKFLILTSLCLFLHTKGTFLIFVAYMVFHIFMIRRKEVKFKYFIYFFPLLLYLFTYQMDTYISNENSVRMVLILNGFRTAIDYFPFGSGFSTYGTNEAAVHYSPLYYKYGFDTMWLMGPDDGDFLNDGYLAGIVGEEGYIGLALFLIMVVYLFKIVYQYQLCNSNQKAVLIASLLCMIASMTATGIFKSISGVFMMAVIGIMSNKSNENTI